MTEWAVLEDFARGEVGDAQGDSPRRAAQDFIRGHWTDARNGGVEGLQATRIVDADNRSAQVEADYVNVYGDAVTIGYIVCRREDVQS